MPAEKDDNAPRDAHERRPYLAPEIEETAEYSALSLACGKTYVLECDIFSPPAEFS